MPWRKTAAAATVGAEASAPSIYTRNAQDMDQSIAVAIFTAIKPTEDGPTRGSTRNDAGGYTVYSLDAVLPGRPESIPLADRRGEAITRAFWLKGTAPHSQRETGRSKRIEQPERGAVPPAEAPSDRLGSGWIAASEPPSHAPNSG